MDGSGAAFQSLRGGPQTESDSSSRRQRGEPSGDLEAGQEDPGWKGALSLAGPEGRWRGALGPFGGNFTI
jgi:hypothetical protein